MCHDCADRRVYRVEHAGKHHEDWVIAWATEEAGFGIETSWRSSADAVVWVDSNTDGAEYALMSLPDVRRFAERLLEMCDWAENGYEGR